MSTPNGVVTKPNFAQAWKRKTSDVKFPSGLEAEMTKPDAISFLTQSDEIPDQFFSVMMSGNQQDAQDMMKQMSPAEMRDYARLLSHFGEQLMVRHSINPRVVLDHEPDYEAGEISLDDVKAMDMNDKQFLINWGMMGGEATDALTRFLEEQNKRLVAAQNGGNLQG
jgi:histidinol phosphatase-like PHP family hydrolase